MWRHSFIVFFCYFCLSACERAPEKTQYSIFAFGTLIDITLYNVNREQADLAFNQLQQNFDYYQKHWSPWEDGDLSALNSALSQSDSQSESREPLPIDVPAHLMPLIQQSKALSKASENLFNPTIGQLINLWQFHRHQEADIKPPEAESIQALIKQKPRMTDLTLMSNNQLTNNNPAVQLNFGAFAKGYAITEQLEWLKKQGINHAVINAGGDLSAIGQHGSRPWNIGIRHPRNDDIIASIEIKNNESVFTSGDYERTYQYQGKRYHHILDPRTGYPTDDFQSVTVLHKDAATADAAATAIFVAGSKQWQTVARKMGISAVMLIDKNGDIQLTPSMQKRIKILNKSPTSNILISDVL